MIRANQSRRYSFFIAPSLDRRRPATSEKASGGLATVASRHRGDLRFAALSPN